MFKCYADGCCVETIIQEAETIEKAKDIFIVWDENLTDDYSEMWLENIETGEMINWIDVVEGWY